MLELRVISGCRFYNLYDSPTMKSVTNSIFNPNYYVLTESYLESSLHTPINQSCQLGLNFVRMVSTNFSVIGK